MRVCVCVRPWYVRACAAAEIVATLARVSTSQLVAMQYGVRSAWTNHLQTGAVRHSTFYDILQRRAHGVAHEESNEMHRARRT